MFLKRIAIAAAFAAITASAAFAQATAPAAPATPARPAAPVTAPATPAAAPAKATAAAPVAKKVNLNTADAKELDTLPQIGEARVKTIMEARAKGKFKDWADFSARASLPKNAEDAIKDKVSF